MLETLSSHEQTILKLRFVQELPLAAIGEQLGGGGGPAVPVSDSATTGQLCEETTLPRNFMGASKLSRFDELVSRYFDAALVDSDAVELLALK